MRSIKVTVAALAATLLVSASARAQEVFGAPIDSLQSVLAGTPNPAGAPPSPGIGFVTITLTPDNSAILVDLSVTGLIRTDPRLPGEPDPPILFHIHQGGPTQQGPTVLDLAEGPHAGTVQTGPTSLFIDASYFGPGLVEVPQSIAELSNNLRAGVPYYVNVHTPLFSAGAVRGNLAVIPEPGTAALLASAALPLLGLVRRRRR